MKKEKPKKVQRIYEAGFKIAVARAYLESKLGYIKIGREYGISSGIQTVVYNIVALLM